MAIQEQTPITLKKANSALLRVVPLVVVIAAAAVIYFIWRGNNSINSNTTSSNVNAVTNNSTNLSPTSGTSRFITPTYSFQPPAGLFISEHNDAESVVQFSTVPNNPLGMHSNTFLNVSVDEQLPAQAGDVLLLLDRKPETTRIIDGYVADVYRFSEGYEGSPPFVVYRARIGSQFYRFDFWNTSTESEEIRSVLDSVRFAK